MNKKTLVLATTNMHKIREIKSILKPLFDFDYLSLMDFPQYTSPEESENTFEGNAFLKALTAAKALGLWVLADDSGLIVPALDNKPGILSSRFAGTNATDQENRQKLVHMLQDLSEENRVGCYVCSMVLASPEGVEKQVTASCEGTLLTTPRGSSGFGYDSIFVKSEYGKTFAEIDEMTKNRVSHRRKALEKMLPFLEAYSNTQLSSS
ncbi:non-canonical purine NTP pyrophosphatase, RdgB/HAM1 family [Candidatus Aerophobetes bacterium]|uniref:dITP/XTP pyrophosphatase n=1 Tax=Aerophobetes bacterium TaxID=2030807 RepID=A0A2A4X3Q6_UNCAE|nr:MAG: non-canonical purine NTP pyrophosphatase, RdgB/HAM1 family [Candidatus Aerophobetes bacterium]